MTDSTFTNLFNNFAPPLTRVIPSLSYTMETSEEPMKHTVISPDAGSDTLHDYGIEGFNDDLRNFSSPTLISEQHYLNTASLVMNEMDSASTVIPSHQMHDHDQYADVQEDDLAEGQRHKLIEMNKCQIRIQSLTLMWRELKGDITKNRDTIRDFFDEFRYILVTSQLLDETILISNFYNSGNSQSIRKKRSTSDGTGIRLQYGELDKQKVIFSFRISYSFSLRLVQIIRFLKYLQTSQVLKHNQRKFISIVLLVNLHSLLNFIKIKNILLTSILLSQLKSSVSHFQQFDVLIMKIFNRFREYKLYNNQIIMPLTPGHQPQRNIIKLNQSNRLTIESSMFDVLNSTLTVMINSTVKSIRVLLPLINRCDLENFVDIYNINLVELNYMINEVLSNIDLVVLTQEKIKKFQKLRRFLLTVLLSINLNSNFNNLDFVWGKLLRIFQLEINGEGFTPLDDKFLAVSSEFKELVHITESANVTLRNFINCNKESLNVSTTSPPASTSTTVHDPVAKAVRSSSVEIQDKLKELLFHFQNISTYKELQDMNESVSRLTLTYSQTLHHLKPKNVQRKPSIQAMNNNIKKSKRFSLQAHQLRSFTSPLSLGSAGSQSQTDTPTGAYITAASSKKSKRLSTGLPIPLLTVLESTHEPSIPSPTSPVVNKRLVSYDDNYINNSTLDSYSVDDGLGLNIKPQRKENAVKQTTNDSNLEYINEFISNDDSVIISNDVVEYANEDDGLVDGMTREEFRAKLELNFAMMANGGEFSQRHTNDTSSLIGLNDFRTGDSSDEDTDHNAGEILDSISDSVSSNGLMKTGSSVDGNGNGFMDELKCTLESHRASEVSW
ncbi:hypothetical protein WICPIJ_002550 [Wickerhamomyces pijperi]|uniref:Myosin-binding domain-containing protein n=1 Tax=Wickerhamomyces pijperi TaxID=599730 RepID=A0A9P8TNU5_WICPI|nr:hypothetical protein WICPIJ_002550 [Wickerhamomyces pijperi]